jgi:hypothetical protein
MRCYSGCNRMAHTSPSAALPFIHHFVEISAGQPCEELWRCGDSRTRRHPSQNRSRSAGGSARRSSLDRWHGSLVFAGWIDWRSRRVQRASSVINKVSLKKTLPRRGSFTRGTALDRSSGVRRGPRSTRGLAVIISENGNNGISAQSGRNCSALCLSEIQELQSASNVLA